MATWKDIQKAGTQPNAWERMKQGLTSLVPKQKVDTQPQNTRLMDKLNSFLGNTAKNIKSSYDSAINKVSLPDMKGKSYKEILNYVNSEEGSKKMENLQNMASFSGGLNFATKAGQFLRVGNKMAGSLPAVKNVIDNGKLIEKSPGHLVLEGKGPYVTNSLPSETLNGSKVMEARPEYKLPKDILKLPTEPQKFPKDILKPEKVISQPTLKEINQFKEVPHLSDFRSASRPADEILSSFQDEASKWIKGVDPQGKLNAYQLASDNWQLRRKLLKDQFGDWKGTTKVYRVGPATDEITSVFPNREVAKNYAKRMGVEGINEFKVSIDDLVPSQSGAGELFVNKNSLIQSQPIKTGVKPLFDKWVKDYDTGSLKKALEIVEKNPKLREESIKNLPNKMTVYKAIQEGSDTPSWTLDKGLAERWAENGGRELESMKISKSDVGYYLGGPESELFLNGASKEIFNIPNLLNK
jgi:hypothetical protein